MDDRYRVVGIVALVFATGVLCVGFGAADHWTTPTPTDLATDPGAHEGDRVMLFGEVQGVDRDAGAVDVTLGTDVGSLEVTVSDVEPTTLAALEPGGSLQIYGTVDADSTVVAAERTVIDHRGPADHRYVYGTSFLGALLATAAFVRHWRIDVRRLRFLPRGEE